MAMSLNYSSRTRLSHPLGEVAPIIDATDPLGAIRQIFDFMVRHYGFRVGVPDTSFFPFSAICHLDLTFPSGPYTGTGAFIGPNLILTCGHNLFDRTPDGSGTEAATSVRVRPGMRDATTWLDDFVVSAGDWTVHPTWIASGARNRGFDLSVMRVTNGPPGGNFFRMINYSPAPQTAIAVCGYGGEEVDSDRQHLDIDRIRAISADGENVEYNLQTRKGNSGSPVFAHFTNESGGNPPDDIPLMGIHVASSGNQLNKGVLLTPDKIEWALGGGNSSVSVFSLSSRPRQIGGLPLITRGHGSLGGLPLGPQTRRTPAVTQSWSRPLDRAWIVIDQTASGSMNVARRTFGHPTHDLSGKTNLSVRVPNIPTGGSIHWNIPDAIDKTRIIFESGTSTSHSQTGTNVTLRSLAAGPCAVDCMVRNASGTTVESNKYWLSSPQFIFVAIHPTADAFLDSIGMRSRKAAILAEMSATMRHLYRNVNIRFVFPGDTLPAHLGLASDPAFPGGVEVLPSVYYSETIGDDTIPDPEATRDAGGTITLYRAGVIGRNHQPGDLDPPMDHHSLARSLVHRFNLLPDVNAVESAAAAGTLSSAEMDMAARMFGRLMGENAAHEVGHFTAGAFVAHDASGFMEAGSGRTFAERTGMTRNAASPILTDGGRAGINDLSATLLHTLEEFLPVNPPIDQARLRRRGTVGSFSLGTQPGGWVNGAIFRQMSGQGGWRDHASAVARQAAMHEALASGASTTEAQDFVASLFP